MDDREALDQPNQPRTDPVIDALRAAVDAAWRERDDARSIVERATAMAARYRLVAADADRRAQECEAFLRRMETGDLDAGGMVQEMTQQMQPADQGRGETCPHHVLHQHRDGKPPWCSTCGRTASGHLASELKIRPTTGELQALTGMQVRTGSHAAPSDVPRIEPDGRVR